MMDFKDLIHTQRLRLGLTLEDVGKACGVSKATVLRWESGEIENIRRDKIGKLSKILQISTSALLGMDEANDTMFPIGASPLPRMVKKPRLGVIACGNPILAEENIDGYDDVPENIDCDFTLECKGDSMINARINDGDIVYIKQQPTVENGEIAAVMVDDEMTLKRVFLYADKVVLQAENSKYEPYIYVNEELNNIRILGKAVGFFSYL